MAKLVNLLCIFFFYLKMCSTLQLSKIESSTTIDILPDNCENLLLSFANKTAKFTQCIITNARPITVCENCVKEYKNVVTEYEHIQNLQKNDSEVDCREILTNIDRLQIIIASYNYVYDMWDKASCKLCLNDTVLNDQTKHVMDLGKVLDICITNNKNSTKHNSTICTDCRQDYTNLNNYYNTHKIKNEFCMDVVDLINNTQAEWSIKWKCHISNYDSEWVLLVISLIVILMPFVFYFINWLFSHERSNLLLSQNRWHERFTNNASTSGYIVIS